LYTAPDHFVRAKRTATERKSGPCAPLSRKTILAEWLFRKQTAGATVIQKWVRGYLARVRYWRKEMELEQSFGRGVTELRVTVGGARGVMIMMMMMIFQKSLS
jgi:hypothetical protein